MSSQAEITRSFVVEHLRKAHRENPSAMHGCMICVAWSWARETRHMDDAAMRTLMDSITPIFDITSVPNKVDV